MPWCTAQCLGLDCVVDSGDTSESFRFPSTVPNYPVSCPGAAMLYEPTIITVGCSISCSTPFRYALRAWAGLAATTWRNWWNGCSLLSAKSHASASRRRCFLGPARRCLLDIYVYIYKCVSDFVSRIFFARLLFVKTGSESEGMRMCS